MKTGIKYLILICLLIITIRAKAQYEFFSPPDAFAIEVSLNNSGLPRLPMYRNAISSLAVIEDNIIGGTTTSDGSAPFIFSASISKREVGEIVDLDKIVRGQTAIRSGFARWKDGTLIAGTLPDGNGDGHLLSITIDGNNRIVCKDLGIPVPGEGIFSLTQKATGNIVYGISYPSGFFFSFNLINGSAKVYKETSPSEKDIRQLAHFSLKPDNYLSRSLITDGKGRIFGSMPVNRLFCFNPSGEEFIFYENALPFVWGREVLGQADSWAISDDGTIYGGNAGDGQLFELNPETGRIKNLGKPALMPRLRGLAFGRDGKLYGLSGGVPGYSHLFSYDRKDGFRDYGNPEFVMKIEELETGIRWRGFQLGTITSSEDKKYIIIGEDEALSQLMVFPVK